MSARDQRQEKPFSDEGFPTNHHLPSGRAENDFLVETTLVIKQQQNKALK